MNETKENRMTAYGVGLLRNVRVGPGIVEYLERIDATLEPYGGRFVIHGGSPELLEGEAPGDLIVIGFPDRETALAWYRSPAYQEILALRGDNSDGTIMLVDGVGEGHRAPDVLAAT
jgi:uncharacterized protein (DUF1330 family)